MRENLHRRLSLTLLARVSGRSKSWVRVHFVRETGKSLTAHLLDLRMEKARRMLAESPARVYEIARACGFSSAPHFTRTFRRENGLSPRAYRDRTRPGDLPDDRRAPATLVGRDYFAGRGRPGRWEILDGTWRTEDGVLAGEGTGGLYVLLKDRLPPAFRVRLSFLHRDAPPHAKGVTAIGICDSASPFDTGYLLRLGSSRNTVHRLLAHGRTLRTRAGSVALDTWYRLEIACHDAQVRIALDGREVIVHRDLLPPAYAERGRLLVGSWDTRLLLRNLEIHSLSPSGRFPRLALADERAAEGDREGAIEIYESELPELAAAEKETETLFKIGVCYLKLGLRVRGGSYLRRFLERRRGTFWGTVAETRLLEAEALDEGALRSRVEKVLSDAKNEDARDLLLDFLLRRSARTADLGALDTALVLARLAHLPPGSPVKHGAALRVLDLLGRARRHREAAAFGEKALAAREFDPAGEINFRLALAPAFACARKRARAREILGTVLSDPGAGRIARARAATHAALLLQAAGRYRPSLDAYREAARTFADVPSQRNLALENASLLLALEGKHAKARRLARERERYGGAADGFGTLDLRGCLAITRGAFGEAAAPLEGRVLAHARDDRAALADRLLLCLLQELAGDLDRAIRALEPLEKRYADGPLRCLALPVSYLLGKITEEELWRSAGANPLAGGNADSVLFYLLGLVQQKRGKRARARTLFRYAPKADPLRFWAARLARRRLKGGPH